MKNVIVLFAFIFACGIAQAQVKTTTAPTVAPAATAAPVMMEAPTTAPAKVGGPVMTFEQTEIDYGTIAQGSDPLRRFKFKNTGTESLTINNARGSCGCTVPTYKHEPILPGETSEIEVRYDTNRVGAFTKSVTIETNEGTPRVVMIKGTVTEKKAEEGVPTTAPSMLSAPKQ
jgi:hypothetical protein